MKSNWTLTFILFILLGTKICAQNDPFITSWRTTNPNEQITIPVQPGLTYRYDIDWGDGSSNGDVTGSITHTYAVAGVYQVEIEYDFPAIFLNDQSSADKLMSIDQWGDVEWESMNNAFYGASNMQYNASDEPDLSNVTDMSRMFRDASAFDGDIGEWDVSNVEHFAGIFRSATSFNQELGEWDMSAAERINGMFYNAKRFNQDLSQWGPNLGEVTDMNFMFYLAEDFNQDIGDWDVSGVTNMEGMFRQAISFNQDISYWDISAVAHMTDMLRSSGLSIGNYDKLLHRWSDQNVQSGVTLGAMGLSYCVSQEAWDILTSAPNNWTITDAGQDCSTPRPFVTTWKTDNPGTSNSTSITIPTFGSGYNFDVDWENDGVYDELGVSSASHDYGAAGTYQVAIRGDFPAIYFNNRDDKLKILSIDQWGDIEWESMKNAFRGASNLKSDAIDTPNLSKVTVLDAMFLGASSFNHDIGVWDVSNVQSMTQMFSNADAFNQDISSWDVSNVIDMCQMFEGADAFNGPLEGWADKLGNVQYMCAMFSGADSFNRDIGSWDISKVEDLSEMFQSTDFNQDIGEWNTENVTNMSQMFAGAELFNQDIGSWNVSNVDDVYRMFDGASSFNQDITNWNTSNVQYMEWMFAGAFEFNQDIGDWNIENVENMSSMLNNSGISQYNYDQILQKWSAQDVISDLSLGAVGLEYCYAESAKEILENTHGWSIEGDSKNCVNAQPCASTQPNTWEGTVSDDWNDAANWSQNAIPTVCDAVIIPSGMVTLSDDAECYSLEIASGADVEIAEHKLFVWNL